MLSTRRVAPVRQLALAALLGGAAVVAVLLLSGPHHQARSSRAATAAPAVRRARFARAAPAIAHAAPAVAHAAASRSAGAPGTPTTAPPGTRLFTDRAAGFALSYPSNWTRLPAGGSQGALLAASPDRSLALLVRVIPIGLPVQHVTLADLPTLRPLTDRLIGADRRVRQLEAPAEVDIHGLVGFAYVYTERPAPTAARIAHIHYFLFDGPTLIALVFQVGDPARLRAVAPGLARIAATLHLTR